MEVVVGLAALVQAVLIAWILAPRLGAFVSLLRDDEALEASVGTIIAIVVVLAIVAVIAFYVFSTLIPGMEHSGNQLTQNAQSVQPNF